MGFNSVFKGLRRKLGLLSLGVYKIILFINFASPVLVQTVTGLWLKVHKTKIFSVIVSTKWSSKVRSNLIFTAPCICHFFSGRNRSSYGEYISTCTQKLLIADSVKVGRLIIKSFLQNIFLLSQILFACFYCASDNSGIELLKLKLISIVFFNVISEG